MELSLKQTDKPTYPPRTKHNAKTAGLTLAVAVDFGTLGEGLTKTAAGDNYLGVHVNDDPMQAARELYKELRKRNARVLNIAGNSIATFKDFGWTQSMINERIYALVSKVHEFWPLEKIQSGGQTGTDLAGGVAGVALGIPTEMTFPKGFLQRYDHKVDIVHTEEQIREQVVTALAELRKDGFVDIPEQVKSKQRRPRP